MITARRWAGARAGTTLTWPSGPAYPTARFHGTVPGKPGQADLRGRRAGAMAWGRRCCGDGARHQPTRRGSCWPGADSGFVRVPGEGLRLLAAGRLFSAAESLIVRIKLEITSQQLHCLRKTKAGRDVLYPHAKPPVGRLGEA